MGQASPARLWQRIGRAFGAFMAALRVSLSGGALICTLAPFGEPFPYLGALDLSGAAYPAPYPALGMGGTIGTSLVRAWPVRLALIGVQTMQKNSRKPRADKTRTHEAKAAAMARKGAQLAKAFRIGAAMPSPVYG